MEVSQFGDPRGLRGWITAHLVARLTGEANRWMVDCLEVGRVDRVLDVGCGPGLALGYAAQATDGPVVGVDTSATMVRMARRRNRALARAGRVAVHRADAADLPFPDGAFTRACSLNSMQFWPSPDRGLEELHRVVAPDGRGALVLMARSDEPAVDTPRWVEETADRLRAAGFDDVQIANRTFGGVLHRALLGRRPGNEKGALLNPTADGASKGAGPSITYDVRSV